MAKLSVPGLGLAADYANLGVATATGVGVAIKESSSYPIAFSIENRSSSRRFVMGVDADALGDGIFFIDDATAGAHVMTIAPVTGAAKFAGSITIQSGGFDVQAGGSIVQALSAQATQVTSLNLGAANLRTGGVTASVGTSATTIYTQALAYVEVLFVVGDDGAGNIFTDIVTQANGGTPHAILSGTTSGAPAARTYSASGAALKLAMASGTYTIRTIPFEVD